MKEKNKLYKNICLISIIFLLIIMIWGFVNISKATSNDTTLKNLTIEPKGTGLIQDEENNKIYRVKVENNVTSIKVNAEPNNLKSTVSIEGNNELIVGTNKVTIKVIAENGETSNYIIYVRRESTPISEEKVIPNVQDEYEESNNNISIENNEISKEASGSAISTQNNEMNENVESAQNHDEKFENIENIEGTNSTKEKSNITNVIIAITIIVILIIILAIIFKKKYKGKH